MNLRAKYKYIMPAVLIATLAYGVINFRNLPIRPCGEQKYCGKHGKLFTQEEYQAYRQWEMSLLFVALGAFIGKLAERGLMRDTPKLPKLPNP